MLTRGKAAKRLGVSIATFRRRYEKELPAPNVIQQHAGREVPLWKPEVIEEVIREEHPPLTPEEQQSANLLAIGEAAGGAIESAVEAVERTGEVQRKATEAVLRENERLTKRVEVLENENAAHRKSQQEFLDREYARLREDREGEMRLRMREEWHKTGVKTLGHLAPAGMAVFAKHFGVELPAATREAFTTVFAGMEPERMAILQAEVANSRALSMEEKMSLALALQSTKTGDAATTPQLPAPAKPTTLAQREADIKARFESLSAEAAALADEQEKAASNGATPKEPS
jgi:hypothetical protein